MSYPIVRAKSSHTLPRPRDIEREGTVGTLTRVTSVPNLANLYPSHSYRPSTLFKYRRDFNSFDDYLHDNFVHNPTVYWGDYRYGARRYAYTDPLPNSICDSYPTFWSRYKFYSDYLNPTFYRRYRDPYYDRPLWDSWRPYMYDRYNTKRAIKMFRQGLISFHELDKKWVEPNALGRRVKDWPDVYQPAARYGTRRYFYAFQ
ncbi:hypothetical protein FO519_007603 [Halicephalobus sp. NKZ332]|nr:hypothetical protein FO519_007603 [Halicephalobus sp. NKZ332]